MNCEWNLDSCPLQFNGAYFVWLVFLRGITSVSGQSIRSLPWRQVHSKGTVRQTMVSRESLTCGVFDWFRHNDWATCTISLCPYCHVQEVVCGCERHVTIVQGQVLIPRVVKDPHGGVDRKGSSGSSLWWHGHIGDIATSYKECTDIGRCGVSRCGLPVRRYAGKQKDLGSIRSGCPVSLKKENCGLWTLSCDFAHTVNETLKFLTQLPIWWWNCSELVVGHW